MAHVINVTAFFKVMLSGKLLFLSIKILVSSSFSMPTLLILSNTLSSLDNHQLSSMFFLHIVQFFLLINHNTSLALLLTYQGDISGPYHP